MANILIATHWTGGDVYPFIRIGKALKRRGHDVTIFTHCIYKNIVEQDGMKFVPWDSPDEYEQLMNDLPLLVDPLRNLDGMLTFYGRHHNNEKTLMEYRKISEYCSKKDTVILARHRSAISALLAAEKFNIPVVSVFLAPNYISHLQIHEEIFGDIMKKTVNEIRKALNLKPIECWTSWICSPKRKLGLWPEWFAHPDETWPSGLICVGFYVEEAGDKEELPPEIVEMLNGDSKPILITAGTSKMIRPEFYEVASEACRILGKTGILVTLYDELVPKPLPDNVKRFQKLSIRSLLPHVDAVIHHGGIGTTSEATAAGIPQLILPHLTDGPDNAHRLRGLGIAELLPPLRWKPHLLAAKLTTLMSQDYRSRCLKFSQYIRQEDSESNICRAIEQVIGNNDFLISN